MLKIKYLKSKLYFHYVVFSVFNVSWLDILPSVLKCIFKNGFRSSAFWFRVEHGGFERETVRGSDGVDNSGAGTSAVFSRI
jgi:hypothetical protein